MHARVVTQQLATPVGTMIAGVRDDPHAQGPALCLLEFEDRPRLARERDDLNSAIGPIEQRGAFEAATPATDLLDETERQLALYFNAELTAFDLPLVTPGTEFQQAVWQHLLTIPHGETTTYGTIADKLGRPRSQRAVGAANGANRIAIVIPCHRVIDASGHLHGYGGGLQRKRKLLELEQTTLFSMPR